MWTEQYSVLQVTNQLNLMYQSLDMWRLQCYFKSSVVLVIALKFLKFVVVIL